MVAGVATLLDQQHETIVEGIWQEFRQHFGVHGASQTPIPHFTYHVAESYNMDAVVPRLQEIARRTPPFVVRTNGLGIFTGLEPTLQIHVRPSPTLNALHRRVWDALNDVSDTPSLLYHPENWHPHITLVHRDMNAAMLVNAVRLLVERDFSWTIDVQTLSILSAPAGETVSVDWRIRLGE